MAGGFTRGEKGLVASAAGIVFTRVLAITLTLVGFTEFAAALPGAAGSPHQGLLVGLALGVYGLTMAAAQLGTGILSDRIGRRRVLIGGTVAFVLGALLSAWATDVWTLMAGRLIQGLGGVSSVALAAVGETVPAERRTTAMAIVGIPAGVAAFLGLALGPLLEPVVGFRGLFYVTAGLGLLASAGFLLRPLPARLPGMAAPRRSLSLPALSLGAAGFAANFGMSVVFFDYASGVAPRFGTLWLGLALLAALAFVMPLTRAMDRRGTTIVPIALALAVLALAAPEFRLGATFLTVLVGAVAFFLAHATISSAVPSQVSRIAGRAGGMGHGFQLVFAYLGTFAGSLAAGLASPRVELAFAVLAAACAVAAVGLLAGSRAESTPVAAPGPPSP